jgi:hypothetical protein
MFGELTIRGSVRPPAGKALATTFWPEPLLRVHHNPRAYPIGKVVALVHEPNGALGITAEIVVGRNSLLMLMNCPSLSFGGAEREGCLELVEVSVLQDPANMPLEEKNPWTVVSGRLPRVIMPWFRINEWPGAQCIEQFEVGWSFHGDLVEVEPQYAIDDHTALRELALR